MHSRPYQRLVIICCVLVIIFAVLQINVKSLALLFSTCQLVALMMALYGVVKARARPR